MQGVLERVHLSLKGFICHYSDLLKCAENRVQNALVFNTLVLKPDYKELQGSTGPFLLNLVM